MSLMPHIDIYGLHSLEKFRWPLWVSGVTGNRLHNSKYAELDNKSNGRASVYHILWMTAHRTLFMTLPSG